MVVCGQWCGNSVVRASVVSCSVVSSVVFALLLGSTSTACYTHLRRYALESLTHVGRAAQVRVRVRARARLGEGKGEGKGEGAGERAGVGEAEGEAGSAGSECWVCITGGAMRMRGMTCDEVH